MKIGSTGSVLITGELEEMRMSSVVSALMAGECWRLWLCLCLLRGVA